MKAEVQAKLNSILDDTPSDWKKIVQNVFEIGYQAGRQEALAESIELVSATLGVKL